MQEVRTASVSVLLVAVASVLGPVAMEEVVARPTAANPVTPSGLPGSFLVVENAGQFDPAVRFQVRAGVATLWVTETSLWLTRLQHPSSAARPDRRVGAHIAAAPGKVLRGVNLKLTFPGHRPHPVLVPTQPRPTRINYLLGSDPQGWRRRVRTWGAVTWKDLYPGISLTLTEAGGEPVLVVQADLGARAEAVRLRVEGARSLGPLPDGAILARTPIGPVRFPPFLARGVRLRAHPQGSDVSFRDSQGASEPIRPGSGAHGAVHPGLVYGTFLGAAEDDGAADVARGPDGSTYLAGATYSPDFPTTPGAFDTTYDGPGGYTGDGFISRLDPTGSTLLYSTFLGGSSADSVYALAVGSDGSAFVGGGTGSSDFPVTPGAFDTCFDGGELFVTKVAPGGDALVYSTFLGGSQGEFLNDVAPGGDGTIYVTGGTNSEDFPTTPGAFDTILNDGGMSSFDDVFVTALTADGADLLYSTFLGGESGDDGYGLTVRADGTVYVTGAAGSLDFPTTPGAYDRSANGGGDVFVARLSPRGARLLLGTYLGGYDHDTGEAVGLDGSGNIYAVGYTSSPDFPTTPGAYDTTINSYILTDAFVARLDAAGRTLVYGTFLGGGASDLARDVSVSRSGSATVIGDTYSRNFPTTRGALDRVLNDGATGPADAFVSRFDPTGSVLAYSSFVGGSASEGGSAVVGAGKGLVSLVSATPSADFPVTPDAYDPTYNGRADAYLITLRVAPP